MRSRTLLLLVAVLAACTAPGPSDPAQSAMDTARGSNSPVASEPTASLPSADPEQLIECRQVPDEICFDYARNAIQGPQPDYAAAIDRVFVTCEVLPPCSLERAGSGGKIIIFYANGWTWTQDWALGAGT